MMKINVKHIKENNTDGYCEFISMDGTKGHVILHHVTGLLIDKRTNELHIIDFNHDIPLIRIAEITINVTPFFDHFYDGLSIDEAGDYITIKLKKK